MGLRGSSQTIFFICNGKSLRVSSGTGHWSALPDEVNDFADCRLLVPAFKDRLKLTLDNCQIPIDTSSVQRRQE
jgi:hypothetical protein